MAYELRKRLRSFELAYRLGGEEFLIALPGIDASAAREVAERVRAADTALYQAKHDGRNQIVSAPSPSPLAWLGATARRRPQANNPPT